MFFHLRPKSCLNMPDLQYVLYVITTTYTVEIRKNARSLEKTSINPCIIRKKFTRIIRNFFDGFRLYNSNFSPSDRKKLHNSKFVLINLALCYCFSSAIYKIENSVDRSLIFKLNKQSKLTDFFKEK